MAGDSKIAADCDSARRSCDWDAHHIILCCFSVVFLLLWPLCRLLSFCSSSEASQTKEEQQQQAQVVNCRLKETTLQQRIYLRSVARLHRVQLQSNMYPQILFLLLILNRIQISTKSSRDTRILLSLDISLFPCLSLFPFRSLTLYLVSQTCSLDLFCSLTGSFIIYLSMFFQCSGASSNSTDNN